MCICLLEKLDFGIAPLHLSLLATDDSLSSSLSLLIFIFMLSLISHHSVHKLLNMSSLRAANRLQVVLREQMNSLPLKQLLVSAQHKVGAHARDFIILEHFSTKEMNDVIKTDIVK